MNRQIFIGAEDVADISWGGALLATGGGGDVTVGRMVTREVLHRHGDVALVPLDAIDDDATVVAVGGVGSPTIMQEKVSNGEEALWALEALEAYIGKQADALIAFEVGGDNSLVPLQVAARRKLPVVDADGMGRAFPELQMETFSIYGVSATPLSIAGDLKDTAIIETRDSFIAERLVRHFAVIAGGGSCYTAEHVMDGKTAKRVSVPGTIGLCRKLGRLLERHRGDLDGFMGALDAPLAAAGYGAPRVLMRGKVVDVSRRVEGGYDVGRMLVRGFAEDARTMRIDFKNEFLVARIGDQVLATVPDLICFVDNDTAQPITAETVRYGLRVAVMAIGAPEILRTPQALGVVAPRCFGFDLDYVPLEKLQEIS